MYIRTQEREYVCTIVSESKNYLTLNVHLNISAEEKNKDSIVTVNKKDVVTIYQLHKVEKSELQTKTQILIVTNGEIVVGKLIANTKFVIAIRKESKTDNDYFPTENIEAFYTLTD